MEKQRERREGMVGKSFWMDTGGIHLSSGMDRERMFQDDGSMAVPGRRGFLGLDSAVKENSDGFQHGRKESWGEASQESAWT